MKKAFNVRSLLMFLGALILALLFFGPRAVQVYVDGLWFDSLGYSGVYWTSFWYKFGLFAVFFALTLVVLRLAFSLLQRAFDGYALGGKVTRFDNETIDVQPEKFLPVLTWSVALLWSFLNGLAMSMRWELFALGFNGAQSGNPDPVFGRPLGFFLFTWPVLQMLASWAFSLAVIILIAAIVYWILAHIARMPAVIAREARLTAYKATSFALALVLLVHASRVYLGRYSQLWQSNDVFTGVGYTQANIVLPGLMMMSALLVFGAVLAILNALVWRNIRVLITAAVLPIVFYFGLGLVTNYVSNFVVKPNQLARETPYIKRNIENTRVAFSLDRMEVRNFPARAETAALAINQNRDTLDNIRIWDWEALQATLRQIQVLRTYYDFPDVDVDRYTINGRKRQVMIAARELDIERLPPSSRNWINERLIYTHGYGVTMSLANSFTPSGRPRFVLSDMPVKSTEPDIKLTRPQIYFGQKTDSHVYVKTRQQEFDFPQGETNAYTTYEGTGGVELGGFLRRALVSWSLGDLSKVPFSGDITPQTRVLMYRNIRERVHRIAPFLSYDADPYVVVANGQLYWIIDAYTSSAYYPYSRHYPAAGRWTNYMRNSVKVVVDAYNGTADFYVAEPQDPVINAYRKTFPALFKDLDKMPAGLREHLRYPEMMFRTQADVYGLYHIRDVKIFFGREDVWNVAEDVNENEETNGDAPVNGPGNSPLNPALAPRRALQITKPIDPYFVLTRLPGEADEDEFVQILPFTPANRRNMIGWMAGRSDGENYGRLLGYDFPKSQVIDGPAQVKARINQDAYLSQQITLWNQQGSRVLRGNMLVIPLGQSLLYIEPIFLQANQSPTPELRLVVLATQDRIVYGTTFQEALTRLITLGEGETPTATAPGATTPATSPVPSTQQSPAAQKSPPTQQLIDSAARDFEEYQRLTSQGKHSEAGKRLESLGNTLRRMRGNSAR
jgi:uncharacterized protein